jgi:hypothetical protein
MKKDLKVTSLTLYLPDGSKLHVPGAQIREMSQLPDGKPMVLWETGEGKAKRAGGLPFLFDLEEPSPIDIAGADALAKLPRVS